MNDSTCFVPDITQQYYFRMALLLSRKLLNISRISKPPEIYQLGKFSTTLVFDIRSSGPTLKKVEDELIHVSKQRDYFRGEKIDLNINI